MTLVVILRFSTDGGAITAGLPVLLLPAPRRTGPRGLQHALALLCPGPAATRDPVPRAVTGSSQLTV